MTIQAQTLGDLLLKVGTARNPVDWSRDLIQADAAAEKLARKTAGECCGNRCLRFSQYELHYRFNEIERQEEYQHDLLQTVVSARAGAPEGADALVRLLPTGCQTIASAWLPYFRTVLGVLELKRWRDLGDWRLTKLRGEAYETWWPLSRMQPNDPLVTDNRTNPADFVEGAELARQRAIIAYRSLVKEHHASAAVITSLRALLARSDTGQRNYVCGGD